MADHAYLTQIDPNTNTSKHYFVAIVSRGARGYEVMTAWGRIGTIGGEKSLGVYSNALIAQPVFDKAMRMKERGGYVLTPMFPSYRPDWFCRIPDPVKSTVVSPQMTSPVPQMSAALASMKARADEIAAQQERDRARIQAARDKAHAVELEKQARAVELEKKKKARARWGF